MMSILTKCLVAAAVVAMAHFRSATIAADLVSTNWQHVRYGHISFQIPPGMTNESGQGIDSAFIKCVSSNIVVSFDSYGQESRKGWSLKLVSTNEYPKINFTETVIGGRPAEIASFQLSPRKVEAGGWSNAICVNFPDLTNGHSFYLWARCRREADFDTAKAIFESIKIEQK